MDFEICAKKLLLNSVQQVGIEFWSDNLVFNFVQEVGIEF